MAMSPCDALEAIVTILSGREWSADTCEQIAGELRAAGYEVADTAEDGSAACNPDDREQALVLAVTTLRECEDVLDDYSDVVDGEDGQPRSNRAMALLGEVERAIALVERHVSQKDQA